MESRTAPDPRATGRGDDRREARLTAADVSVPTTVVVLEEENDGATASAAAPAAAPVPHFSATACRLVLTRREDELFRLLLRVVDEYNDGGAAAGATNAAHAEPPGGVAPAGNASEISAAPLSPVVVPAPRERLEVRVAGGWVRDKLLGRDTQDIDLTVNCLSGLQFAKLVVDHMARRHAEDKATEAASAGNGQQDEASAATSAPVSPTSAVPHVSVIAANPDQSKHLETATFVLLGFTLDVCALRGETYAADSRIPTTALGTPLEDARRRDFTMNALFFNLGTRSVEDWTRRGLRDLRRGLIVTPLLAARGGGEKEEEEEDDDDDGSALASCLQTFRDDPLRVLRAVRFAVRYRFRLHPALRRAAGTPEIHRALHVKVSRERVGKELTGAMLNAPMAVEALQMIWELKMAGSVFILPEEEHVGGVSTTVAGTIAGHAYPRLSDDANGAEDETRSQVRESGWLAAQQLLELVPALIDMYQHETTGLQSASSSIDDVTQLDEFLFPLAVFLLPFRNLLYKQEKANATTREYSVIRFILKDGVKFKNSVVHSMGVLTENVDEMAQLLTNWSGVLSDNSSVGCSIESTQFRLEAGLLIRATKELWVTCLLLATVIKMSQERPCCCKDSNWPRLTMAVYQRLQSLQLDKCWKAKPLLNGKAMMEALDLPKGRQVGEFMDEQIRWMLLNPNGKASELVQHLMLVKKQIQAEPNGKKDSFVGICDGMSTSPRLSSQHYSKKMQVESMDLQ